MTTPLYNLPFGECEHRVVWWLLAKMDANGYVDGAWKSKAARDLNLHQVTVSKAATKLIRAGVIVDHKKPRGVNVQRAAFNL